MTPPHTLNVLDQHGGFTCESRMPYGVRCGRMDFQARGRLQIGDTLWRPGTVLRGRLQIGDTLWRPGTVLRGSPIGQLLAYDENSFYQNNNDVTVAVYRVPGYGYPVIVWFDNVTGERADDAPAIARKLRQRQVRYMVTPHGLCERAEHCVEHEQNSKIEACK